MSTPGRPTGSQPKPDASSSASKMPAQKKIVKVAIPTDMRVEWARLSYKAADSKQWITLPCFGKTQKHNVGPVFFGGDISITQKTRGNRCIFKLRRADYNLNEKRFVLGNAEDDELHMVIGHFQVVKPGTYSVESDKGDDASIAQASSCPLANFSSTFTEIRLVVPLDNALWRVNGQKERRTEVLKGQLTHLCTGHSSANPESKWAKILRGDKMALEAESEAQKEQFGTMRCRIFTHAGREDRSVVVEVFPSNLSSNRSVDAKEFDWENKKVGETYRLKAPGTFPTDEVTMRAHKKFGEPVTFEWSMAIVKNKMGYEAPIVGIIENSFDDITSFVGVEEDNVALEPIFNNVLGERAQDAVGSVKNAVDDFKAELKQFVSNPKYRPQVPAVQLFGLEKCDDAANTLATHNQLPRELTDSVNQSQSSAIENILNHKISVTWGAPGTGKSRVLSETILFLLDNTEERIVATAGANVAVDPLLRKVLEGYRSRHPSDRIPIIRVYSQAQIFTQYATGEFELLDSECHLEALRVRRASNDPEFAGFLNAVRQLRQYGKIRDEAIYKAYISQGSQLTRTILENEIRLVFCTITGCQSPALYKVSPKDHEIEWAYPATSLFLDEAGTMTRPMMEMPVMAFVKTTTRVGMAGDPFQLPATIISDLGKKEWAGSWLKKIVDQKWPVVFLNVQYRMPDMLYDHLNAVTYVNELKRQGLDKIDSFKHVGNPTDFGARLQAALPIIFQVGIQSVAIDSIENFIDVADGIQESLEGGSSWNTPEINAINNAVLELVSRDFKQEEIAVITGYSEQKRRLTEKAKGNGWAGVQQILTIDSSQGDEFKIVFISLVLRPKTDVVSASERLKAFTLAADERRKAAKAAKEKEMEEARRKHAAEIVRLEQQCTERLRLLEEDIAEQVASLRLELQLD